jgi:hypothetical protein
MPIHLDFLMKLVCARFAKFTPGAENKRESRRSGWMRQPRRQLGGGMIVMACLALSACAFTDGTVDGRYDTINRSTDAARNQAILLNIVRASRAEPLNFVAFSKIGGTTSTSMGVGLPTFLVGPERAANQRQLTIGNNTLNATVGANSNFDIAILENRDFYSALLTPVDEVTLNFFERQGYPRELLFWLFADSVRITYNGKTAEFRNEPSDEKSCEFVPQRRCFVNYVDAAIDTGFRVETRVVDKVTSGSDGKTKLVPKTEARTCFDPVLADRAKREVLQGLRTRTPRLAGTAVNPICGKSPWPREDDGESGKRRRSDSGSGDGMLSNRLIIQSTPPQKQMPEPRSLTRGAARPAPVSSTSKQIFEISTRSTYGIYQYLGRILAEKAMSRVRLDGTGKDDAQVLTIVEDGSDRCFIEVEDAGRRYCVPSEGAENTKRIISLLAQLLALKTPQSDLPFTPTVRVTP